MANIAQTFASFRAHTTDDTAAALLTLAAVLRGEHTDETPLTVNEAAERLNVSPDAIYDMCKSGQLPCQRVGKGRGTIRIRSADLDNLGKPRVVRLREIA